MSYYPPDLKARLAALLTLPYGLHESEYQKLAAERRTHLRTVKRWVEAIREELAHMEVENSDLTEDLLLAERKRVIAQYREATARGDKRAAGKLLAEKRRLEDILHDINGWIF